MRGKYIFIWVRFINLLCALCSQLAEQYGANVATKIVARSRSNLRLDTMPYAALSSTTSPVGRHMKYDSLSTQPPKNET